MFHGHNLWLRGDLGPLFESTIPISGGFFLVFLCNADKRLEVEVALANESIPIAPLAWVLEKWYCAFRIKSSLFIFGETACLGEPSVSKNGVTEFEAVTHAATRTGPFILFRALAGIASGCGPLAIEFARPSARNKHLKRFDNHGSSSHRSYLGNYKSRVGKDGENRRPDLCGHHISGRSQQYDGDSGGNLC
jgi:hypothetical protein